MAKPQINSTTASVNNKQLAKLTQPANSADASQKIFMTTMLGMSWQMAIAVLVPTVGGYKLDAIYGTTPYLTIIGLLLALAGMVAIVVRAIKNLNKYMLLVASETVVPTDKAATGNKTYKEKRTV